MCKRSRVSHLIVISVESIILYLQGIIFTILDFPSHASFLLGELKTSIIKPIKHYEHHLVYH